METVLVGKVWADRLMTVLGFDLGRDSLMHVVSALLCPWLTANWRLYTGSCNALRIFTRLLFSFESRRITSL